MAQVPREDRDAGKQCGGQEDAKQKRCEFDPLGLLLNSMLLKCVKWDS